MKLELKGVGPLRDAEIGLDGLTVILGQNGSGKSTILRSLYCLGDAPLHFEAKKRSDVHDTVENLLLRNSRGRFSSLNEAFSFSRMIDGLIDAGDVDSAVSELRQQLQSGDGTDTDEVIRTIERVLHGEADDELVNSMARRDIEDEFSEARQMRDLSSDDPASASVSEGDDAFGIRIGTDNGCAWFGAIRDYFPSVVYYDTPFVLDGVLSNTMRRTNNHRDDLAWKLEPRRDTGYIDEMIMRLHAERFYGIIRTVLDGEFQRTSKGLEYIDPKGMRMNASNLAAGAKVFAIMELLANNGLLSKGSLVLLDEPEVHLHPGWINILAELIVLLRKDIGARIVMTTHSPQLLLAVQAFSKEHGVDADYYSLSMDGSRHSEVTDLRGNLRPVYALMAGSFQEANLLYRRTADDDERPGCVLEPLRRAVPQGRGDPFRNLGQ